MWGCGRVGFQEKEETSGINKDKTESILTTVVALQPMAAQCLPPPPCMDYTDTGGDHALLSVQHPATTPTQGNTWKKKSEMQMLLSDHQTALQVISALTVHGDKQLAQKVQMNFSSLALMAVAIYGVKQSFLNSFSADALMKHTFADSTHFHVPFHPSHLWNQYDLPMESRCWNCNSEAAWWAKSKQCSLGKQRASTSLTPVTGPSTWSNLVHLCHQRQHTERGTVEHSPDKVQGESTEMPVHEKLPGNFSLLYGLSQAIKSIGITGKQENPTELNCSF